MEITYPLERLDYWRFTQAAIRRVSALRRQVITRYLFLPIIFAVEFSFLHVGPALYVTFLILATVLWACFVAWTQKRVAMRAPDQVPGALGLHTMRLEAGGFRVQSLYIESSVNWEKLLDVAESADLFLFLISPHYGFIVPRRVFGTSDQAQAFLQTARAYWQAARDGTTPILPQATGTSWLPMPRTMT